MKRILTILSITTFTALSCSENKSGAIKTNNIEKENGNKSGKQNAKFETSDTINSGNYYDEENQLTNFKDINLFWVRDLEENTKKKVGFISLSDIYQLSEHPDSLAIPNLESADKQNLQYIKLNSIYRERFLSKTNITETDSVFIYDYSTDALLSFSVNKLNVVASLNFYMDINDCPCSQNDYMIGFEVAKSNLKGLGKYYNDALVFIGKENPFTKGQMKPIIWRKIKSEVFPSAKSNLTELEIQSNHKNTVKGQAYLYETNSYQIFIQDYKNSAYEYIYSTQDRHLMIINKQYKKVANEMIFSASEGSTLAPLNFGIDGNNHDTIQWIGHLFKDRPDVIFGFEWVTFGCPTIMFVNSKNNYIQIKCDNRH